MDSLALYPEIAKEATIDKKENNYIFNEGTLLYR